MTLLLPFLAISIVIIITPGPDMALVMRNAFKHGRRSALVTSLGVICGLLAWGVAAALGVAVLLEANAFTFLVVKLVGAAYLGYLGIRALVSLRKSALAKLEVPENHLSILSRVNSAYLQGLFNNILNPKIAIFFTSLLPQFIGPGSSFSSGSVELAGLFALMTLFWLGFFSVAMSTTRSLLRLPRVRKALDAVTGTVLLALGLKVAVDTN